MKRFKTVIFGMIVYLGFVAVGSAETVTEGTLDIQGLANRIAGTLQTYIDNRDRMVAEIGTVQKGIAKLKIDFERADRESHKTILKARTLRETTRLLNIYSQFYQMNVQTVDQLLPKLQKLKKSATSSAAAQRARTMISPEMKQQISNLYQNLATGTLIFGSPSLKKEVGNLLKEYERLFQQSTTTTTAYIEITGKIDKMAGYLKSVYVHTLTKAKQLELKTIQAKLAVDLMEYTLAIRPMEQAMRKFNSDRFVRIPEISIPEFNASIQKGPDSDTLIFSQTGSDLDDMLKDYQKGPAFTQ